MSLGLKPLRIKCSKDLFMAHTNEQSFTKGKIYETDGYTNYYNSDPKETMIVIDDRGEKHRLGDWYKHFKTVKQ